MEDEGISPLKVMKSAAGYFVGRQYKEDGVWLPYDRITEYFQYSEDGSLARWLYYGSG